MQVRIVAVLSCGPENRSALGESRMKTRARKRIVHPPAEKGPNRAKSGRCGSRAHRHDRHAIAGQRGIRADLIEGVLSLLVTAGFSDEQLIDAYNVIIGALVGFIT